MNTSLPSPLLAEPIASRLLGLGLVLGTLCLAGCSGPVTAPGIPSGLFAKANETSAATSSAPDPGTGDKPPTYRADLSAAMLDLADPDAKACRAVSDGGTMQNLAIMTQLAVELGTGSVLDQIKSGNADLSKTLEKIRPGLRELSRRVVWLPESAEALVGDQLLRLSNDKIYTPNPMERRIVETVIRPAFDAMTQFARQELKSSQNFELLLYQRPGISAEMVPGGKLVIPQGLVRALAQIPERDAIRRHQIVGFVLAHEFSHALRRHLTKSTQVKLIDSMTMVKVFKENFRGLSKGFSGATEVGQMFDLSEKGIKLAVDSACHAEKWFTDFNQNQEFEADVCGALLLTKVPAVGGRRIQAMDGLRQYARLSSSIPAAPVARGVCVLPASHPEIPDRERNLEQFTTRLDAAR